MTVTLDAAQAPPYLHPRVPARRDVGGKPRRARRRTTLIVKVLALVVALLGAGMWYFTTREVTVIIDGKSQSITTRAMDVAGVLDELGHHPGRYDKLSPPARTKVESNQRITWDRARKVSLVVDGQKTSKWVTHRVVDPLLKSLPQGNVKLNVKAGDPIALKGATITVRSFKTITLTVAKQPRQVQTYAGTVKELIKEQAITVAKPDRTVPPVESALAGVTAVAVQRITTKTATETVVTEPPVQKTEAANLMLDQVKVEDPGAQGKAEQHVTYVYADGDQVERNIDTENVISAAKPRKLTQGTKPYPPDDTGLNWAALAQCEAGGNPKRVSANGSFHGLYQFLPSTWRGIGGIGLPSEATPREQTYRAILLYKRSGNNPWPQCGPQLHS